MITRVSFEKVYLLSSSYSYSEISYIRIITGSTTCRVANRFATKFSFICRSISTWLNLSRSMSLLGLCALLWMIESFASPSSKQNSMVVVPFALLLSRFGILFLLLPVTALPSPPSKLALKLTSSNSILTCNGFSAAQIWNSLALLLFNQALAFKLVFTPPPPPNPPMSSAMCVCVCELVRMCSLLALCECVILCVCVCVCACKCAHACVSDLVCLCFFAMLCMKMFVNFHTFVRLYILHYLFFCFVF